MPGARLTGDERWQITAALFRRTIPPDMPGPRSLTWNSATHGAQPEYIRNLQRHPGQSHRSQWGDRGHLMNNFWKTSAPTLKRTHRLPPRYPNTLHNHPQHQIQQIELLPPSPGSGLSTQHHRPRPYVYGEEKSA